MLARLDRNIRRILWPAQEPELADAGRAGEIVIARGRLFVAAMLALPGAITWIRTPHNLQGPIGIALALVATVVGFPILRRAHRGEGGNYLGLSSVILDVTLVTLYQVMLAAGGDAESALHSRITFVLYTLAITVSALRYDGRLVRIAGVLAVTEYLGFIAWANASGHVYSALGVRLSGSGLRSQLEYSIILLTATALAAVIVDRAQVLRLSGIRDPLTGLANRGYFHERAHQELMRTARTGRPSAVAMLDLDHFKSVNDKHGHAAGDLVLRRFASVMRRTMRASDLVARLGGEEFAILLPETSLEVARIKLDAIRATLRETDIALPSGQVVRVTFSAGIAAWPEDGTGILKLLQAADDRLLAGKRRGRDVAVAVAEG
ncbi:MAG TPA: GGDEF domain-containing protein [Gemmatimonadaceae bacterium]|nr:GGDEF domain-containing protein [Gemmatimonadaceae bacterium]